MPRYNLPASAVAIRQQLAALCRDLAARRVGLQFANPLGRRTAPPGATDVDIWRVTHGTAGLYTLAKVAAAYGYSVRITLVKDGVVATEGPTT